VVQLNSPHLKNIPIKRRHFGSSNTKIFRTLNTFDTSEIFQCKDVNIAYNKFITIFNIKFNDSFPSRSYSQSSKQRKTKWYDNELKYIYRKKYKKFIIKPSDNNKNNYHIVHNLYDRRVKTKKQAHIKLMLEESKNNS